MRRAKDLEARKNAKKALKRVSHQLSHDFKACAECGAPFDKTDDDMLDRWTATVRHGGQVQLLCEACSNTAC